MNERNSHYRSASGTASPLAPTPDSGERQPHLALLHGSMLLSGFGTVFLGPVLPTLAAGAHTSDAGSGVFFLAQFIGAFLGGVTTTGRLWRSLLRGSGVAAAGFFLLAMCTARHLSVPFHVAALLPLGFGVGQMLTSTNLLASRRSLAHRGAALSLVNFTWSLGAVLAPFLLGSLLPAVPLGRVLLCVGGLLAIIFTAAALNARVGALQSTAAQQVRAGALHRPAFLYFATLLLVYGGVETSLSGWITTFGTRYGSGALRTSTLGTTALWIGITAGRALAPVVLRRTTERAVLLAALSAATLLTAALSISHGANGIVAAAGLLGLSLAPWFPLTLAAMLGEGAAASQVGTIIAVSGIGAAVLPLLVGAVSRASGSLRVALVVPLLGLMLLLFLGARVSKTAATTNA